MEMLLSSNSYLHRCVLLVPIALRPRGEKSTGGTAVVSNGASTTVDGAATRKGATGLTGRLAVALIAALALFAFQLAHAQSSSSDG